MRRSTFLLFFLFLTSLLPAQTYLPGQTYFATNNYIEYHAGNLPIIVAAPHNGDLNPVSIPDRTCPNASTAIDIGTQALVRQIDSALCRRLGCYPHIIISRLSRRKLDANRDLPEAACDNPEAALAWEEYHAFIDSAKAAIAATYGRGLFIDLHGHGHTIQRLELGYLLSGSELLQSDSLLNLPARIAESSIRHLADTNLMSSAHAQLLRDSSALGTLLHTRGYPSVPSLQDPTPQVGEPYFNGGYSTWRHGFATGGAIDAIQIETYYTGVRNNTAARRAFADTLATVVQIYFEKHYFGEVFTPEMVGSAEVCQNGTYTYSVPALPGNAYWWTALGGEIVSGQGTATIQVKWTTVGGPGSVTVQRICP